MFHIPDEMPTGPSVVVFMPKKHWDDLQVETCEVRIGHYQRSSVQKTVGATEVLLMTVTPYFNHLN